MLKRPTLMETPLWERQTPTMSRPPTVEEQVSTTPLPTPTKMPPSRQAVRGSSMMGAEGMGTMA